MAYGEVRVTHDIDLVAAISGKDVDKLVEVPSLEDFHRPPENVIRIEAARPLLGHFNLISFITKPG
jgi:hypothetical protein